MKRRYCEVYKVLCEVGWGQLNCKNDGTQEIKSCFDLPVEKNCRNLIEEEKEHFFFDHIREVIKTLKVR